MRLRFYRVYKVRKFDGVLNEKNRHVVADQIEVAFIGKKFHGKAANVAHRITRPARSLYRGKTHKYGGFLARVLQETRLGQGGVGFVRLKVTMGAGAPGVDDTFWNAFVVKMRDLLAHDEVFKQRRASGAGFQGVLIV